MRLITLLLLLCSSVIQAQTFKASLIPDSLLQNADAVKRFEEMKLEIKSYKKAVLKHKYAITVLNENGDMHAYYSNSYSQFVTINDISGVLYDSEGKKIKSIKRKDIVDVSASNEVNLLSDTREKRFAFYCKNYPYTVEFEDEQSFDGIFFLPDWSPISSSGLSVQQSKFVVETPMDYQLRHKQNAGITNPLIHTVDNKIMYTWEMLNAKPIELEMFHPDIHEIIPSVLLAPTKFEIANFKGDMSTWQSFGQFISELNKGRSVLPLEMEKEVKSIAAQYATVQQKVKALYQFLQNNTRYISIQLGIGSWQPFEAKFVAEKKYGDCKALSNFMKSILDVVGIPSNYVLIQAGKGKKGIYEDFPSPYFNHATLLVPDGKDTIWLECTSQTVSAGYAGYHTGNKKALAITNSGGIVVSTPQYGALENVQNRTVTASVDETGQLTADVKTQFSGLQQEQTHNLLHEASQEERDKYLNTVLSLPTYKVEHLQYHEKKGLIPVMEETMKIIAPAYATITGKRLFITPNLFNKTPKLPENSNRQQDIQFKFPYTDIDTIKIAIPNGYKTEALPKEVAISNQFGTFHISYKVLNDTIKMIRQETCVKSRFPAEAYAALKAYHEEMYKADRGRIVFIKQE